MHALDTDQLRTFLAIAEEGGFTKAADRVHKTQSAVSMQIKKLEDQLGRTLFAREGRSVRLTSDGQRLRDFASRILHLNDQAIAMFHGPDMVGQIRLGLPDDYVDRLLPKVLASFDRAHPGIEIEVFCESSTCVLKRIREGRLDVGILTQGDSQGLARPIRREQLLWVTSESDCPHERPVIPLALGPQTCSWRTNATRALTAAGLDWRIAYTSASAAGTASAVCAGLAVSVMPESGLKAGMRVLTEADGFPMLDPCEVGFIRADHSTAEIFSCIEDHIIRGIGNLIPLREAAE
ncbi:MAG: LysR substrate-binding domain-containing protein [Pseudomonadota bacterium]